MSILTVAEAKQYLRVTQTSDDELLASIIDQAEDECLQYLDRPSLPRIGIDCPDECDTSFIDDPVSDGADLPQSIKRGLLIIVQASYEGRDADEMMKLRKAAETCWAPFRCRLGA